MVVGDVEVGGVVVGDVDPFFDLLFPVAVSA
jgi:hypothetical protein